MARGKHRRGARQVARAVGLAHEGASTTAREIRSWQPGLGSADADLLPELGVLTARARDLDRNHGIAQSGRQALADNVVGTGLRLSARPNYRLLGQTKAWADEWGKRVEDWWEIFTETCDAARTENFGGLTTQIFNGALVNGDGLALPVWLPERGTRFATAIHVIEADRLCNPQNRPDTVTLRGGIEQDQYGAPVAYWIRKSHPGDWLVGGMQLGEWERVPAFTPWGRRRVIHVHDKARTGQSRGKPLISAVMKQFRMFDQFAQSELQASIINAMIAAFIKTPLDAEGITDLFGGAKEFADSRAAHNRSSVRLEGGAIIPLHPGDDIAPFAPARPSGNYAPFVETVLRHIAAGMNIPYELLLKDFSKTNYSSARASLLEAWRFFLGRRDWLSRFWAAPIYLLFLEELVDSGLIDAPGFYEHWEAYAAHIWIGPGRGWIDPVKEASAAEIRMAAGISTLQDECAEQGKDWREVLEQRATEWAYIRELDIAHLFTRPAGAGQPPANPGADPVEEPPAAA